MTLISTFWRAEDGQDLIEYSLLMSFIALAVIALLSTVGSGIGGLWVSISSKVSSATVGAGS